MTSRGLLAVLSISTGAEEAVLAEKLPALGCIERAIVRGAQLV